MPYTSRNPYLNHARCILTPHVMKTQPVVSVHVCALELHSIFKMAAKFTLKLSILPVNKQHKTLNLKSKQCGVI